LLARDARNSLRRIASNHPKQVNPEDVMPLPNLVFAAPRAQLDTRPADPKPAREPAGTGDANLTSHVNDAAMRRKPPRESGNGAVGASHSDASPLTRSSAAPLHEDARRRQDAEAADLRARRRNLPHRKDVEDWREFEEKVPHT